MDVFTPLTRDLSQQHLRLARELLAFKRLKTYLDFGCNSIYQWAICKHDLPPQETRAMVCVAEMLETLPALRAAAEQGRISWYKLRLLTPYATEESDEALVHLAGQYSVDQLRKALRYLAAGLNPDKDTEKIVTWKLDVHTIVLFEHALRKLSEQQQRRLSTNEALQRMSALVLTGNCDDAALQSCRDYAGLDILAEKARELMTLRDLPEELKDQVPEIQLVKVADLPPWENRLLRFNPHRHPLTPAQRTELMRRDGYCCSTPGCQNTLWLQVHHIVWFYHGGVTVRGNLAVLCSACHRMIHKRLLILKGRAPDGLDFRDRFGRLLRPPPDD
jgi:hypothetical protein